jgi:hypothetical protein
MLPLCPGTNLNQPGADVLRKSGDVSPGQGRGRGEGDVGLRKGDVWSVNGNVWLHDGRQKQSGSMASALHIRTVQRIDVRLRHR